MRFVGRKDRSIDLPGRFEDFWYNILFQCDLVVFLVNCYKAFWPPSPDYLSAQVFSQMFSIKDSLPFLFCFCFFNWYSWVMHIYDFSHVFPQDESQE